MMKNERKNKSKRIKMKSKKTKKKKMRKKKIKNHQRKDSFEKFKLIQLLRLFTHLDAV